MRFVLATVFLYVLHNCQCQTGDNSTSTALPTTVAKAEETTTPQPSAVSSTVPTVIITAPPKKPGPVAQSVTDKPKDNVDPDSTVIPEISENGPNPCPNDIGYKNFTNRVLREKWCATCWDLSVDDCHFIPEAKTKCPCVCDFIDKNGVKPPGKPIGKDDQTAEGATRLPPNVVPLGAKWNEKKSDLEATTIGFDSAAQSKGTCILIAACGRESGGQLFSNRAVRTMQTCCDMGADDCRYNREVREKCNCYCTHLEKNGVPPLRNSGFNRHPNTPKSSEIKN